MKATILFSFIVSAIAIQCPNYQCGTLAAGVCAQVQNSSILLNQDGCPNGQACNLTQVWDPIGAIPAESVQCVSEEELDTNPLKLLNITEFIMPLLNQSNLELQPEGNVTASQVNVTVSQVNVTAAEGNVTAAEGNVTAAEGNVTAAQGTVTGAQGTLTGAQGNLTAAEVNVTAAEGNVTAASGSATAGGGRRRLQGGRGGVGQPISVPPGTTVNVTTVSVTPNATAPPAAPANLTTPITTVNVTTVPPLANATAGQPEAQPPPQPSGPANVTAVPISGAPNVTAPAPQAPNATAPGPQAPNITEPAPQAPTPTPPAGPAVNQTAPAPTNATLVPTNVTEVQPSENITSTGQENVTSVAAGILQVQNQTAPTGQTTVALQNTVVISTDNATNTTVLDVSNIAQTLSQFIQQNESGYNVDIPGIGLLSIQSQQKKISCVIAKNRNLASGQAPFECNTDADCLLEDGTFATCICGMDGTSYCKPDYYDDVFSAFKDQCKNGEMDQEVFVEWVRYHQYYIPLQTAPDCGENLFIELQRASQSEQIAAESSGEVLALSLAMILLLLT